MRRGLLLYPFLEMERKTEKEIAESLHSPYHFDGNTIAWCRFTLASFGEQEFLLSHMKAGRSLEPDLEWKY